MAINAEMLQGSRIGAELVGDNHRRHETLLLEQLAHQLQRRSFVAPALNQHVEDFAFVVDGAPEIHSLTADPNHHLIEVPLRSGTRAISAQPAREYRLELEDPLPDCFVRDVETTFGEQLLNVAVAQRETEIQPDGVLDDEGGEAVPTIAGGNYPAMVVVSGYCLSLKSGAVDSPRA